MICFQVTNLPNIGDRVKYNGRSYQIISDPKQSRMNYLFKAKARLVTADSPYWDLFFYFELV